MNQTIKTKMQVPLIGKLAVKFEFITKEQLKRALLICNETEKEGSPVTLPEILIRTEMIQPEGMKKLHKILLDYEEKQHPTRSHSEELTLKISEDKLKVELVINGRLSATTGADAVIEKIKSKGIKFGVVKDYVISNYLNNIAEHGKPIIVARGNPVFPGTPPVIECFFNSEYFRNESLGIDSNASGGKKTVDAIEEGDLLIEKTGMIPSVPGVNVFGEDIEVDPIDDIAIRAGFGTELFEEEMKIFATSGGIPILSVDGRLNVFQTATINGDYGVTSGPVKQKSNLIVSGIVTGEYPVRGGSIAAMEIRDANIDVSGDINVDIGITGSVIKCEGDISAKYIHGSVIETYGSVITEGEIIDSTIITSGICRSRESKIIASVIASKRGVKAAGIGTRTSAPCEITIGKDVQCQNTIKAIDAEIEKNNELVFELKEKKNSLSGEQNSVNQKVVVLMDQHKQLNNAMSATENNIAVFELEENPDQLASTRKTLVALKKKYRDTVVSIREMSGKLQGIGDELNKTPEKIRLIEKENEKLELDKKLIICWEKRNKPVSVLEVKGELAAGTIVVGANTFEEIGKKENVSLSEKPVKGSDPQEWEIVVGALS